jgi:transketolase
VKPLPEASTREAYGKALVELGKELSNLVVLDADLSPSTMTKYFAREFPSRFFDCGLAEQNLMSIAAGLAAAGLTAFASTFATFATAKAFDQIRVNIAMPHLNVKVVATHAGISVGEDGISHQAIEDLALMCSLPSLTVIVPADAAETVQAARAAARSPGPFYIRLSRPKAPVVHHDSYRFSIGKAELLSEGRDATIIACGLMVARALQAAEELAQEGLSVRVLNMATLQPPDEEAIAGAARETGAIVTAEEHLAHGGLASRVAGVLGRKCPAPLEMVALHGYAESGKAEELLEKYCLTPQAIAEAVKQAVSRK